MEPYTGLKDNLRVWYFTITIYNNQFIYNQFIPSGPSEIKAMCNF